MKLRIAWTVSRLVAAFVVWGACGVYRQSLPMREVLGISVAWITVEAILWPHHRRTRR